MTKRKDPNAPQAEHTFWPKRRIVEIKEEQIGEDPYTGKPVVVVFDFLECGHKKKRAGMPGWGSTLKEQPNVNRRCKACFAKGETA